MKISMIAGTLALIGTVFYVYTIANGESLAILDALLLVSNGGVMTYAFLTRGDD